MNTAPTGLEPKPRKASNASLWLALSLVANAFLLIVLYNAMLPLGLPTVPPVPSIAPLIKTNVEVRRENFTWEQIESTNYELFIKNLRAVGCPEPTIRDIIIAELDRIFEHRRLSEVVYPNYQWWLSDPDPAVVQAASDALQAIEKERRGVLTALLGPSWDIQNNETVAARGGVTLTGPILGDLPQDVKDAVYAIAAKAQLKIEAWQADLREKGKLIDGMELVRLREEPLSQLASVLNPVQYEEYVLRYSPAAQELREQMRSVTLGQEQFRDLFNALSSISGQPLFYYTGDDPALLKQQRQLHQQCEAVIKAILGEQLYALYQLNQDPMYRSSKALAEKLGLPAKSAPSIYEINRATQAELNRIRRDTNMTSDEKVEALSQTQVEQQQSLQQLMGPEIFQRWLQTQAAAQ